MARALGLDLGSSSVKALVLETGARGARQLSFYEVPRQEGGDSRESLKAALRQLIAEYPIHADNIVVSLPGSSLVLHPVTLPFNDPKRIEATLPFELEGQLPFELSEAAFDYQVVGRYEGKTHVLAGVVRQDELRSLLELLQELELDPRIVLHPAVALHNILAFAPQLFGEGDSEASVAVVDIGQERTCVAVGRPVSGIEWARTFAGGGRDLSRALAGEFRIPVREAQEWKEIRGAIGSAAVGPEGERASAAFQRGLAGINREIRGTLKAFAANTRIQTARVYLCGGTSRLPGLSEQLNADLGLPVQLLPSTQELAAAVSDSDQPLTTQALALALRAVAPSPRAARFNLRRGPFAFSKDTDSFRDQLARFGLFAAGLVALFLVFTISRSSLLSSREQEVDKQLCEVTQRVLDHCEPNYDRALNLLQGKESPTSVIPKHSALGLLAELSERVPNDLNVKFDQVVIDPDRVMLRGDTDSPHQIDTLSKALKGSACFKEITEGKVEKSRSGTGVSFRLDVQIQCPDEEAAR